MKINVPFFKQTTGVNCGPASLKMVLDYFGKVKPIEEIELLTKSKEGKGVSTIQLATVAAKLGLRVDFYSKHLTLYEENLKLDFYKKYSETDFNLSKKRLDEARKGGVNLFEKGISLEKILFLINEKSVPIVLLDWNIVSGVTEKGYQGHFVPMVGYDEENIYVHNPGLKSNEEFMKISKEVFEKARKAKGTDEDFLVIYKN